MGRRTYNSIIALLFSIAIIISGCNILSSRTLKYETITSTVKNTWSWDHKDLPIVWSFTCDFPEQFKFEVRKSFEYWDDLTEEYLFFEHFDCFKDEVHWTNKGMVTVTWKDVYNPSNIRSWGTTYRDVNQNDFETIESVKIRFWTPWLLGTSGSQQRVARHEIGHALGFHHLIYDDCLMFKHSGSFDLCDVEKKEFMRLYGKKVIIEE